MSAIFESVYDLETGAETIRRRSYGVVEMVAGRLQRISFRPWPKIISMVEANWIGGWTHKALKRDQCLFYFNQPLGHQNFLALKYVVSTFSTTMSTCIRGLKVMDEIARIKKSDAIVCEITNDRMTDQMLERYGWERHLDQNRRHHFIKRFYGEYPDSCQDKNWVRQKSIVT